MFKTSTLFVLLVISALQLRGQWFYQLPTYKLLKDSCVTEIIVKQFELTPAKGWVTDTKRDPDEKVKPSEQLAHYYINTFGNVDSLIYYHNGKRFGGFILKYDAEGHLIQTHEFRPDRPYMAFNKIKKTEEGFRIKYYSDQKLWKQSIVNSDSVITEDQHKRAKDSIYFRYNPENHESFRNTYINDSLMATGHFHWKLKDGIPDSLIIISEFFDDRVIRHYDLRGSGRYEGRFKVFPDGTPLIPKNSVFHRVMSHYNYFTHHDTFRGLYWEAARHFSENKILRETSVHLEPAFDDTTARSFCTMKYTFGHCKDQ